MVPALSLVVLGSLTHASWNYLVKRRGTSDLLFVWLYSVLALPIALGLLGYAAAGPGLGPVWWAGAISAVLHTAYAIVLQRAYHHAPLSVVLPVSRGVAPGLVALATIGWLGPPRPSFWAALALIALGLVLLTRGETGALGRTGWRQLLPGLWVALAISGYSLWDGIAISGWGATPLVYIAVGSLVQAVVLTLASWQRRGEWLGFARVNWRPTLAIGLLVPTSYLLVLFALEHLSVVTLTAVRTLHIVFAAAFGILLLGENRSPRKLLGIAVVVAGVVAAALTG
ncbi:EamA family transporter [Enemella evansiae]|uniref:EamA family transporter n=1 Tax=Enemella evansiae TaxID=2016499 RepID=UPI000B96C34F|nr:EamA family transporter [Enemella evansiae]OYO00350.1 hypothetical protein CGZ96_05400 [Enemella evansiae]OYO03660.1 hypothetical protein CGZ97_09555 [Enemella evansiae]PFG68405.1 glucose uptake protein GlcU [Propionibacteriaceae bacterium ES.041]